jgi:hypothetical protein
LERGQILVNLFNLQSNGNPFSDSGRIVYEETDMAQLRGHFYDFVAGTPKRNKFSGEFRATFKANSGESGSYLQQVDTLK